MSTNAEVDFVVAVGPKVVPMEVKAGKSGSLKSLQQFVAAKKSGLAIRFDANRPSTQEIEHKVVLAKGSALIKYKLISLPVYLAERYPDLMTRASFLVTDPRQ